MKRTRVSVAYVLADIAGSVAAWILFWRLTGTEGSMELVKMQQTGIFLIPVFWVALFYISGFYIVSLKRSRLEECFYSFVVTLHGTLVIFLVLIINGLISDNDQFLNALVFLFLLGFLFTYLPRLLITSVIVSRVHRGRLGLNTLIIGSGQKAASVIDMLGEEKISAGNIIKGHLNINGRENGFLHKGVRCLGAVKDLPAIIGANNIEEVIIASEDYESGETLRVISDLQLTDVTIKAIPSLKDFLTGRVEHTLIYGTPFLEIPNHTLSPFQSNIKTISDYLVSAILIIILLPVIAILAVIIKLYDGGPVLYRQERIGHNGKPFTIYKFRSMKVNAEASGPALSGKDDKRVTPAGRYMRRHRLDEIPNLLNVLKGEMSLVGPRPERQFYIDQIVERAPHYRRLLKVKPGITSWGQVKFGYASDVGQMTERLRYDLLYTENMSLLLDLKILIYTIIIIVKGKGM